MAAIRRINCLLLYHFFFTALLTLAWCQNENENDDRSLSNKQVKYAMEERALKLHTLGSITLMSYVVLMVITVLIAWLLKYIQSKWLPIHETGLALILGALIGLSLYYFVHHTDSGSDAMFVRPSDPTSIMPADYALMKLGNHTFTYRLLYGFDTNPEGAFKNVWEEQAAFSPELFYNILLPPIIFHAGYGLKKKQFFRNIGSIMTFAFAGTAISCVITGFFMWLLCPLVLGPQPTITLQEMLFFGAIISATDPVTVLAVFSDLRVEMDLYALVGGESLLNDVVAIVLAQTIEFYYDDLGHSQMSVQATSVLSAVGRFFGVFAGSFLIGCLVGVVCALFTKFTKIHKYPMLETSLFLLMSYLSFLMAESASMTGIVAILFCGMCQAHYTYNNLSEESRLRTKQFFEALNFLSENFIFTYIGVSLFTSHSSQFNFWFAVLALVGTTFARCVYIYGLSFLLNFRRKPKISAKYQHMLVFAGLRGAMAYALALRNTSTVQRKFIYTATSLLVAFTVLVNGGFTMFTIDMLGIKYGDEAEMERLKSRKSLQKMSVIQRKATRKQSVYNPWDKSFLPRKWYYFDASFMKPLLTHSRPSLMETLPACCLPLARLCTSVEQIAPEDDCGSDATASDEAPVQQQLLQQRDDSPPPRTVRMVSPAVGTSDLYLERSAEQEREDEKNPFVQYGSM